jgi:hypothetical protein
MIETKIRRTERENIRLLRDTLHVLFSKFFSGFMSANGHRMEL